jgi:hypothetical protein
MKANVDFYFSDQGSLIMLTPMSKEAETWTNENIYYESWQMFGDAIAVDPRIFEDLFEGIVENHFRICNL